MNAKNSKIRRKLNKSQIVDILERNVALYKDEENFVHYLVDLAVYLLEFEYDWADSDLAASSSRAPIESRPLATIQSIPGAGGAAGTHGPNGVNIPISANGAADTKKVYSQAKAQPQAQALNAKRQSCPYCGTVIGDVLVCPSCRNLTR